MTLLPSASITSNSNKWATPTSLDINSRITSNPNCTCVGNEATLHVSTPPRNKENVPSGWGVAALHNNIDLTSMGLLLYHFIFPLNAFYCKSYFRGNIRRY